MIKKLLKKRLVNHFGDKLTEAEIKSICKLKYAGWGRLSEKFLTGILATNAVTGEVDSIIGFMWSTNQNLMQLLSENYDFLNAIKEENGADEFTSLKKEVENLFVSPKVKRPIYQTMKIVEEIVKIIGCAPKKIFVEVARGEEAKKRTVSRKNSLIELYKSCKKDSSELIESLSKWDDSDFRRDALFLYYTQMGKCMYTGKIIPIEDIFNKNLYDIDHIFPQSKIKDDSLDNRVLVTKISNEEKGNIYPISSEIRTKQAEFWKVLLSKGLISKKKYDRLVRNTGLTDDELSSFINRQLVETRQSAKAIAQLLNKRYSSDIVYVKAGLVSEFRQHNDFIKCRDVNDLHHAKDAYLNIVVGNVYDTRFTRNKVNFIKGLQTGAYSLNAMYNYDTQNAWIANGENKSIDVVRTTMNKNNIRFTRYSAKQQGGLFDQNILKKGNGQVSIKKNSPLADISKYGGYNKAASTYFAIVSYIDKKGNRFKSFVPINLYDEHEYRSTPVEYITRELLKLESDATDVQIVVPCVKYNALISVNGFRMHISGKMNGGKNLICKPAIQLVLDSGFECYIKKIKNYLNKCAELKTIKEVTKYDGLSKDENKRIYDTIKDKLLYSIFYVKFSKLADSLEKNADTFSSLSVYEQCFVLINLLNIIHSDVRTGDLTYINGSKNSGRLTIGNKIIATNDIKSFKLINQSITGMFEQETELID